MVNPTFHAFAATFIAALIAVPAAAQQPPSRIANTYNGQKHQPTPAEVSGRGGSANPSTARAETQEERSLYKNLLGAEEKDGLVRPGTARR